MFKHVRSSRRASLTLCLPRQIPHIRQISRTAIGLQQAAIQPIDDTQTSPPKLPQLSRAFRPHAATSLHHQSSLARVYETNSPFTLNLNGSSLPLDPLFLRDACKCSVCVNSGGQKNFQINHIPRSISVREAKVEGKALKVTWNDDIQNWPSDHCSEYDLDLLNNWRAVAQEHAPWLTKPAHHLWGENIQHISDSLPRVDYEKYMHDDSTVDEIVKGLGLYGVIFIRNVPESQEAVSEMAKRIGPVRDSFYGRTWDVKDKPNAENVAYTSQFLGFHMDLLYMADPPGLQLLHCLRASCEGGESMFADSFDAAERLRADLPDAYRALAEFPVTYEYFGHGHHYKYQRPTIVEDPYDAQQIDYVNWSPPFQGAFSPAACIRDYGDALRRYQRAADAFDSALQDPSRQLRHQLVPGECVIFHNRRIVHGRQAFISGSGERWLKGTYVDTDAFLSRWRLAVHGRK